jgi:DNA-binding PadR family transcriptional regulator
LELAVLGLLKEKTMHGYELKKNLDEQLGHFWQFSYGSLYPTLKRLSREGFVEMELPKGETSRRKNVYRITPSGESLFTELLEATAPDVEDRGAFMLRFAFSRYMSPETRRRLLEGRRGYLQGRLTKMAASLKKLRDRMDAYSIELMRYGVDEAEHDIRWLDGMLEAERANGGTNGSNGTVPAQPSRPVEGAS